jgi:hypothetical protein
VVLSSPYWLTVTSIHGINLFVESFGAQQTRLLSTLGNYARFEISRGSFQFLWNVMIFGGILWAFAHRRFDLLAWFAVLYIVPREGRWMVAVPASILAGIGIVEVFDRLVTQIHFGRLGRVVVWAIFSLYILLNPLWGIRDLVSGSSTEYWSEAITAMQWADKNLPADSKIIVLCDDNIREWVPHIARRTVLNVEQGTEWEPDEYRNITKLNRKLDNCLEFTCIATNISNTTALDRIFFYLDKARFLQLKSLSSTEEEIFEIVWQNRKVVIGQLFRP